MTLQPRLNRLFRSDGRCFKIALDHAFFNEFPLLDGLRNIDEVLGQVVATEKVDAILLSMGQARRLQSLRLDRKPSLVMRGDISNIYSPDQPTHAFSRRVENAVEEALRLDAVAILLNLFLVPDNPRVYEDCLANILALKPECERWGMPLILEPLVLLGAEEGQGYELDGSLERVLPLHRLAVELGAHVIKSDPTDSVENYDQMVEIAGGIPLLPRGGSRVGPREILERTRRMLDAGASGVVYGRNIFQQENVGGMIDAIHAVIHEDLSVEEAFSLLQP